MRNVQANFNELLLLSLHKAHTHNHKYISKHVLFLEFVFGWGKNVSCVINAGICLFVRSYRPSFGSNVTGDYKTAHLTITAEKVTASDNDAQFTVSAHQRRLLILYRFLYD